MRLRNRLLLGLHCVSLFRLLFPRQPKADRLSGEKRESRFFTYKDYPVKPDNDKLGKLCCLFVLFLFVFLIKTDKAFAGSCSGDYSTTNTYGCTAGGSPTMANGNNCCTVGNWFCTNSTVNSCGSTYSACISHGGVTGTTVGDCSPYVRGPANIPITCTNSCTWVCSCVYGVCAGGNGPIENDGTGCTGGNYINCCAAPVSSPVPTPSPGGCVPGGCDTSGCNNVCQGSACGWDGCNNCSTGTKVCSGNTVPTGYHDGQSGSQPQATCRAGGWATDPDDTNVDLRIRVFADVVPVPIITTTARNFRSDLTGICPSGTCAFDVSLWGLISNNVAHSITVQAQDGQQSGTWVNLSNTPKTLTCLAPSPTPSPSPVPTPTPPSLPSTPGQ